MKNQFDKEDIMELLGRIQGSFKALEDKRGFEIAKALEKKLLKIIKAF